jgi:hypothetical protein
VAALSHKSTVSGQKVGSLVCLTVSPPPQLNHQLTCHPRDKSVGWRILLDAQRYDGCVCCHQWYSFDKDEEENDAPIWLCVHCLDLPSEPEAIDLIAISQHVMQEYVLPSLFLLSDDHGRAPLF